MVRPVFLKPYLILGYPDTILFCVNSPLHGLPEPGNHWFFTYHTYHTKELTLIPSIYHPCHVYNQNFFFEENPELSKGIVSLQTDDPAYCSSAAFCRLEDKAKEKFDAKKAEHLTKNKTIKFNSGVLHYNRMNHFMSQIHQVKKNETFEPQSLRQIRFHI